MWVLVLGLMSDDHLCFFFLFRESLIIFYFVYYYLLFLFAFALMGFVLSVPDESLIVFLQFY